jgi:hypothetical protein
MTYTIIYIIASIIGLLLLFYWLAETSPIEEE